MSFHNRPHWWSRRPDRREDEARHHTDRIYRPTGVTVLAVLNFVGVGLSVLVLLVALVTPRPAPQSVPASSGQGSPFTDMLQRIEEEQQASAQSAQIWILASTSAIEIPLGLITGIGLWRLRSWARKLALFLYGGGAILLLLLSYSRPLTGSTLITILIGGMAFIYLLRPEVRAAFYDQSYT